MALTGSTTGPVLQIPDALSEKLTFMAKVIDGGDIDIQPAEIIVASLETIESLSIDGGAL